MALRSPATLLNVNDVLQGISYLNGLQVEAKIARHTYGKEVYLHALPLCHVGGLVMWLAMLRTASTHILMEKYEPEQLLALVAEHSVTSLIAVPAVVIDILRSSNQVRVLQVDLISCTAASACFDVGELRQEANSAGPGIV